ncbi:hypothetical protein JAAARDRAFT_213213 [Jaapia argillacea MUCL 33604]|uniref:Uncharacterized protein n=1 Tax=Jaapia argillacea MUCL 33604 TaxID=933084 RepID=A0A067QCT4_9AGAM|nr:hypothetical protein JAAARDRAFT_213213 [Jaapia argillacea MUCL 33604]
MESEFPPPLPALTSILEQDQFSSEYIQCPCSPPSPSQKPQANTGGDVSPSCDDPMLLYGTHPSVHTTSKLDDHSKEDQHSGKGKGKGKCKDDQYELDLHLDLDRNKDEGDESKVDRACIMGCTPIHKFTSGPCPASRQVCPLTGRTCWTSGYTHVEGSQKIEYDDLHGPLMTESWDRPWSLGLGRRLEQDRGEGSSRSGWKVWKRWKGK